MAKLIVARFQRNFLTKSKKEGGVGGLKGYGRQKAKGMGMKVVGVLGNNKNGYRELSDFYMAKIRQKQ